MAQWPPSIVVVPLVALLGLPIILAKEPFDWIAPTSHDRQLTQLEWYPDAPAVFLNRHTRLAFGFTGHKGNKTQKDEYRRLKILNTEGLALATVSLPSADFARIKHLDARIIQPDGRVRALAKKDIFEKERSEVGRYKIISFALPQAEIGSIIEYRYSIVYENVLQPWQLFFQGWLPVLESTIAVEVHEHTDYNVNIFNPFPQKPETKIEDKHSQYRGLHTKTATYTLRNLPLVPDEPFSPPFEEIAARVELMPHRLRTRTGWLTLAENSSWENLARTIRHGFIKFREWAPKTEELARTLTSGYETKPEKAEAVYEFVRSDIELAPSSCSDAFCPPDKLLKTGKADVTEKAMLLQHMLTAVGIPASVAWLSPRTNARMDPKFPDFAKINSLLVVATIGDKRYFLDPLNRHYRFGSLQPHLEGTRCLLVDSSDPEWVDTPQRPAGQSVRRALVEIEVDETGRVTGKGRLEWTGHQAWLRLMWNEDSHPVVAAWKEWVEPETEKLGSWLKHQFPGLDVTSTDLDQIEGQDMLAITWTMTSRDGGDTDFISLSSSAPVSLEHNPFSLAPERRHTQARLLFPLVDEIDLRVRWPEGWELEGPVENSRVINEIGELRTEIEYAEREFHYRRIFRLNEVDINRGTQYKQLRELFAGRLRTDLQQVTLTPN